MLLLSPNTAEEHNMMVLKENNDLNDSGNVPDGRSLYDQSTPSYSDSLSENSMGMQHGLKVEKRRGLASESGNGLNVLLLQTDQQRFDTIRAIQDMLPHFDNKTKIQTPNLDKLMERGTTFTRHYVHSPSCGPSRGVMRTGCTIERSGLQTNSLPKQNYYTRNKLFEDRVNEIVGFDQVLKSRGYNCEVYGKWHLPTILKYVKGSTTERAVDFDSYDYRKGKHTVASNPESHITHNLYRPCLEVHEDELRKTAKVGEQINTASQYPYTPTKVDARYGMAPGAKVKTQTYQMGRDSLGLNYTTSHCQAIPIPGAMERLVKNGKPWLLDVSYKGPHAPYVATGHYFDRLWQKKDNLFVSPSNDIAHLLDTPYKLGSDRLQDPENVKEFMVSYYALIEEVDYYVGEQLEMLDKLGQTNNTLVIFTSDHGEQLGAHGKIDKGTLYDETMLAPMIFSLPGQIPAGKKVNTPTTTLDLFATILDYTGSSDLDNSDGKSLRRFIEDTNINLDYDNEVVVSEHEHRQPEKDGTIPPLRKFPHLMVVKGDFKLMIHKLASLDSVDMFFNLKDDRFEMNNLIGKKGKTASDDVIGKVEHLKALAVEWMERMDGPKRYFSDPKYNGGIGNGYIAEVNSRRNWKKLPMWISDTNIRIGKPVLNCTYYQRNEYFYLGRSSDGLLQVSSIKVVGQDAHQLKLSGFTGGTIKGGEFKRVKITFMSNSLMVDDAYLLISHSSGEDKSIKIMGYDGEESQITVFACEGQVDQNEPVDDGVKEEPTEPVDDGVEEEPTEPVDDGVEEEPTEPVDDGVKEEPTEPIEQPGEDDFDSTCLKIDKELPPHSYGQTRFNPGEFICRGNMKFGLTTQGRILYMVGKTAVWEPSNSSKNRSSLMIFRPNGNLAAFGNKGLIWSSDWISGKERFARNERGSILVMKTNGVEIISPENVVTWGFSVDK